MDHCFLGSRDLGTGLRVFEIYDLQHIIFHQGAIPTAFNAWLPVESFMDCVNLTTPKVLILDSERLDLLYPRLPAIHLSVILVRPASSKPLSGSRVREWSNVMVSYTGPTTAWQKEPETLPDDNATVSGKVSPGAL